MMPKLTLITFTLTRGMMIDQWKEPSQFSHILESTTERAVEIYPGAYVFETQKGWPDMHRLCEVLRAHRYFFLRLPFDGELCVYTELKDAAAAEKMGLEICKYPEFDR